MNIRDAKTLQKSPLETPTGLGPNAVRDLSAALNIPAGGHLRAVLENEKFPLAHVRSAFSRLSPVAR
jgi:hypothetical protein